MSAKITNEVLDNVFRSFDMDSVKKKANDYGETTVFISFDGGSNVSSGFLGYTIEYSRMYLYVSMREDGSYSYISLSGPKGQVPLEEEQKQYVADKYVPLALSRLPYFEEKARKEEKKALTIAGVTLGLSAIIGLGGLFLNYFN